MRARRIALRAVAVLLALPLVFLLTEWIGAAIPRNGAWREPARGVTILLGSNGVHTEIVMPIRAAGIDWRDTFARSDLKDQSRADTHVAVSWGERSFFLETPSWAEFDLGTALGALSGGEALLHVAWHQRPRPGPDLRPLRISAAQYRRLAAQIAADLAPAAAPAPTKARVTYPGYGPHDVFYAARGTYHLGNSCNQWTSDRLAAAGVRTGWWTPLPGGVMQWAPPLR